MPILDLEIFPIGLLKCSIQFPFSCDKSRKWPGALAAPGKVTASLSAAKGIYVQLCKEVGVIYTLKEEARKVPLKFRRGKKFCRPCK